MLLKWKKQYLPLQIQIIQLLWLELIELKHFGQDIIKFKALKDICTYLKIL